MFYVKRFLVIFAVCFGIGFQCYANNINPKLAPLENNRLRIFEILYPQNLTNMEQKKKFLKSNFKSTEHYDIYTFPHKNIEEVYVAYVKAYPKDSFGVSVLHKELPKTNKAFKAEQDDTRLGYILMYIWNNDKHLIVTNTTIDDDNLCGKDVLEFEQKGSDTILKSSFEQYCFN